MTASTYRELDRAAGAPVFPDSALFVDLDDASALAEAIVDTIRDPLLVLDRHLCVVTANRAFHQTFGMKRQDIHGHPIYGLGDGEWDIPELRLRLEEIGPGRAVLEPYEFERDLPVIGRRSMQLIARAVFNQKTDRQLILLVIEDVTDRRASQQNMVELLQQKETLLQEMQHRVINNLQIIASILMLKTRKVQSEEGRKDLRDAYDRVMSMAIVQQQLQASGHGEPMEIAPYLSRLCGALAASMISDNTAIKLEVEADAGTVVSGEAVSIGLIVTELVMNALKHAFPGGNGGSILVRYAVDQAGWRLSVSDNGIGLQQDGGRRGHTGLGVAIVEALARQLKARVETTNRSPGITVSIVHTT
jgi:chemotaxis protein methyltransferase CheR